jgi:cytochrome c nitrite reductase small subunit
MSKLPFIIAIVFALAALGYFVFATDAVAYVEHEPETCANCHVMDSPYENWYHGGHEKFAQCSDCHLPHENFAAYYAEKSRQGVKDTYAFVTGNIPAAIRANDKTKVIVEKNCIRCHAAKAETVMAGAQPFDRYCWNCHRSVAHGDRGTSSLPYQDASLYPMETK